MLLYYFFIFLFGLAVGSFLNVVIFRLENGWSIVNDRSKCMHCKHVLSWYDLFPILSFVALKARCRYCKKKISWQYPIVEISTALIFLLIFNFKFLISNELLIFNAKFLIEIFYYFFIASAFIVIFVYDLNHYIIPDEVIYLAIAIALVFNLYADTGIIYNISSLDLQFILNNSVFINHFFAAVNSFIFFFAIVFFTNGKGMGGGDVKLGFLMGLLLGWPMVFLSIFLSFILGSVVGILLVLRKKKNMKSMIPFGPFLIIGTMAGLFWGEEIARWYFGMIN